MLVFILAFIPPFTFHRHDQKSKPDQSSRKAITFFEILTRESKSSESPNKAVLGPKPLLPCPS